MACNKRVDILKKLTEDKLKIKTESTLQVDK